MCKCFCGRGEIRVQNRAMWAQPEEVERPIPLLVLTQYIDESPRIEADYLRSLKSECFSRGIEQATWTKRQNNVEGSRNVQVMKKENIQVKYPSSPHSMCCINSASRINSRMTLEQYSHSLQHILSPLAKP